VHLCAWLRAERFGNSRLLGNLELGERLDHTVFRLGRCELACRGREVPAYQRLEFVFLDALALRERLTGDRQQAGCCHREHHLSSFHEGSPEFHNPANRQG
jgi:hypothetical protein